jgi:hypothetical protein
MNPYHNHDLKRAEFLGRLVCITRLLDYDLELLTKEMMISRLMDGAKAGREVWDELIEMERTVREVTK